MPPNIRKQKKWKFGLAGPTVAFGFPCPMMALVLDANQIGKSGGLGADQHARARAPTERDV